jgi:SNF2 family DNA or RNA helicase
MGAGKTRWAVALDQIRRTQDQSSTKTLVICNQSAFNTPWYRTFKEFTDLRVMELNIENAWERNNSWKEFLKGNHDVLIVHWHALLLLPLEEVQWLHIIADEVHKICSRKNKWTKKLKSLKPVFKLGLSGTLSKGPADSIWSPLNWILPKKYSDYWRFRSHYTEQDEIYVKDPKGGAPKKAGYKKMVGPANTSQLRAEIRPYYCRHMKKRACCPEHPNGIMADMPDKLYDEIVVHQPDKVMQAFHGMRKDRIAWVEDQMQRGVPITAANAAVKMMRLIQFAVTYATIDPDTGRVLMTDPSAKLDALMEKLSESDEQILIWSNFKQVVKLAEARMQKAGITYSELTGDIKGQARQAELRKFIDGASRVMIGTIATGSESIDGLQHVCNTEIFIDRSYSVLQNQQAEDRLWRAGQDNHVYVIDIIAEGTLDRGRHQHLEMQWEWIHELLTGSIVPST